MNQVCDLDARRSAHCEFWREDLVCSSRGVESQSKEADFDGSTVASSENTHTSPGGSGCSSWNGVSVFSSQGTADASSQHTMGSPQATARRCQGSRDLKIVDFVMCFMEQCRLPRDVSVVTNTLLRTVDMMQRCGYAVEDLCSTLAHASVYLCDLAKFRSSSGLEEMSSDELITFPVLMVYMAHTYVLDQCCPLHVWNQFLFHDQFKIHELDKALISLFRSRGFKLRVPGHTLHERCATLFYAAVGRKAQMTRAVRPHQTCVTCGEMVLSAVTFMCRLGKSRPSGVAASSMPGCPVRPRRT
eukprot:TRINITY_DN18831_c0_g1_i2.p1 TRINITY_DN18831_c0_g1~~TRINITY_DN18831_c0_g1_i2.p1  ORF type:complete len:301 (-),score=49.01 TRINITY_DN18831_c0_g1_i2:66-968(-)